MRGLTHHWLPSLLAAAACLGEFAWEGNRLAQTLSVTTDEPGHFGAGLSYWRDGNFNVSTKNFFFTQRWAAWPLAHRREVPWPSAEEERRMGMNANLIGESVLFGPQGDPRQIIAPARRMTLVLAVALGFLVWGWATRLGGARAGLFATLLYATSPVILANSVLVTTDLGTAFWYACALASYAWLLAAPGWKPAILTGASGALLLLSKLSGVALVPAAAILLGLHVWIRGPALSGRKLAAGLLAATGVALATLWGFFGFGVARAWDIFPAPLVRELALGPDMLQPRYVYLLGRHFTSGQWDYFPVAFLSKSTLALLLSLAVAAWRLGRWQRKLDPESLARALPLAAPVVGAAVFFGLAMASDVNLGVRHILPVFPLAAIIGGVALAQLCQPAPFRLARFGWSGALAAVLVAALGLKEGLGAMRQPQAWFNAAVGGPSAGYQIMADSSLDWGGDLPELVAWEKRVREHDRQTPIYYCHLGEPDAHHYGSQAMDLTSALRLHWVSPGYFVFSATRLVSGPNLMLGPWTAAREALWESQVMWLASDIVPSPAAIMATARIAAYCRLRAPLQRIGPVFFVYKLDRAALDAAFYGPAPVPETSHAPIL